jgi:EF hand
MLTRRSLFSAVGAAGTVLAMEGAIAAQKQPLRKTPDQEALALDEVEQLLLLMDADKNGKISKAEWMKFMETEFDRLDVNKSGDLDVKEIAQSRLRATRHVNTGK